MSAVNTVSLIFGIVSTIGLAFLGYILYNFIKTLTPYQLTKLKNLKISNTKINKNLEEKIDADFNVLIQEPIMLDLFPQATAYAAEKNAAPNLAAILLKKFAPAIPSLVAGSPVQDVALGEMARAGADMLGSEQGLKTVQGIWQFVKLLANARKNKQVVIPQASGQTQKVESQTI